MSRTRRVILQTLAVRGEATVVELAEQAGVKAITVRHHLTSMNAAGLITRDSRRQPVGRPCYVFSLTAKGQMATDAFAAVD